jgi:nucleoside phosphorylase
MKTWTQNISRNAKVKKNGVKLGQIGGKRIVAIQHNMGKVCMKTWTQNMSRNAKVKKKWGKTGQTWGKRCSNTLVH